MKSGGAPIKCHFVEFFGHLAMKRSEAGSGKKPVKDLHSGKKRFRSAKGVSRLSGVGKSALRREGRVVVVKPVQRVLKGDFDMVTGLSTITSGGALASGGAVSKVGDVTRHVATHALDVLVTANHIFQLKPSALDHLKNFSEEEIHELVVPKRTLARRVAQNEPLSIEETDKAVRLARVDKLAAKVFGDSEKASRWLRKPKASLGGETPLAYLATEAGARAVEEMLNGIDHGIFA